MQRIYRFRGSASASSSAAASRTGASSVSRLRFPVIGSTPDASCRERFYLLYRHLAPHRDNLQKRAIGKVHAAVQCLYQFRVQCTVGSQCAGKLCSAHAIGVHAHPLKQLLKGRKGCKNADTAGNSRRGSPYFIRLRRDVITTGCGDRPHGYNNWHTTVARLRQLSANHLRGKQAAATAVDTQYNRADTVVFHGVSNQSGK